jgi:molybdopterin adenylyltransferase
VSSTEHKAAAPHVVRAFILTISDTRNEQTDTGGRAIQDLLTSAGHHVVAKIIVKDEPSQVAERVRQQAISGEADVIITTGGTGITSRDSTFEAIDGLLEKRLPGFGELFRMLSYQDIGSAAIMSRACAGTLNRIVIVALPGSESAVRLAMTKLLLPELGHLVQQARR